MFKWAIIIKAWPSLTFLWGAALPISQGKSPGAEIAASADHLTKMLRS